MSSQDLKREARLKRKKSIRKRLSGSGQRPRLCVFRSARHIYAQVIDDTSGETITSASTVEKELKERPAFASKIEAAAHIGERVAQRAMEKGIKQVVFDRNGFLYHGRVKAVSDGARKAGLIF